MTTANFQSFPATHRLKPDPIPAIHPVPEHSVEGRRALVYEETKSAFQVPWMGVVAMAFSHYEAFYSVLWRGMSELYRSDEFDAACDELRVAAEAQAAELLPPSILSELAEMGYAPREVSQIRSFLEIFSHGNMPYLLMATQARLLLEGRELGEARDLTPRSGRYSLPPGGSLILMEAHHADAPTRALYEDIKASLGLPFVNTDYRALGRWPSYLALAWRDLRGKVSTPEYDAATNALHARAAALVLKLPNPAGLRCETLQAAEEAGIREVLPVVRLFQWLLPGLILNVAYLRQQLAEQA